MAKKNTSWVEVKENSDFSIHNIPFGIYSDDRTPHHACTAIGDLIIDLHALAVHRAIDADPALLDKPVLNDFIAKGKSYTSNIRSQVIAMLTDVNSPLSTREALKKEVFRHHKDVQMLMPVHVGDYTDFYSSIDHATNVGKMFRDPENALLPNWRHLPVGYHGRSSSIQVSGHSFYRPKGQRKPADSDKPVFGPTQMLDIELETAFIIGRSTQPGDTVSTERADDYIFGMVLFNDWSARDIQTWEYVPLGPFLAKNFASTVSPWIVTLEALEPFRVKGYEQIPAVLPYLRYDGNRNLDIRLEVYLSPVGGEDNLICASNYKYMYWTMEQQLAHHTVNGCNINVGDLMASGTISGPDEKEFGSLLELTWRGTRPLRLKDGSERKFVNDYDTVTIRGFCQKDGIRVGFGECTATVLPAKP
jgi:fumarylacetoacetase